MTKLLQQLIEDLKEEKYLKPKYKIKDLYVGEIVKCKDRKHIYLGVWDNYYEPCKDFAIFYKVKEKTYVHIKSGQKLTLLDEAIVGDYCIRDIKPFLETYPDKIRELGYTEKTKLSKCFIDELETAQNIEWAHGPIPNHKLFGA